MLDKIMEQIVVVKLLGQLIGYKSLLNRIQTLWKPIGSFQVIDIDNDYFLVKFSMSQGYTKVLIEGPWMVYGNYLTIQPSSRDFLMKDKHPSKTVAWMRLLRLPFRCYNKKLLRIIAGTLGKVVKIDYNTIVRRKGKFARFTLVVDLKNPLKAFVGINGVPYCVKYEGLSLICYSFGHYGHSQDQCPLKVKEREGVKASANDARPTSLTIEKLAEGESCFGTWMQALSRKR